MTFLPLEKLRKRFVSLDDGKNWQKACAAEDWSHPVFQFVLREVMGRRPSMHRKQWEFVVILIALIRHGVFNGTARGISFGSGREMPLYVISRYVEHLIATDLYVDDTGWTTARTTKGQSPTEAVLSQGPLPADPKRLSAQHMDMRHLDFDDRSFDFAYSSCAFEHIGKHKDFVRHLREVRRVLKPGGVYVMTTEFTFGNQTYPVKGNYKFCAEDLFTMIRKAQLSALPTMDCAIDASLPNRPRSPLGALGLPATMERGLTGIILQADGIPYTSCALVLTPEVSTESKTDGRSKSRNHLERMVRKERATLFSGWRSVSPFARLNYSVPETLQDHEEYLEGRKSPRRALLSTAFFSLGTGDAKIRISLAAREFPKKLVLRVFARRPMRSDTVRVVKKTVVRRARLKNEPFIEIEFACSDSEVYSLVGVVPSSKPNVRDDAMINVEVKIS